MTIFHYQPMYQLGEDRTRYRRLKGDLVHESEKGGLVVKAEALELMAREAFRDMAFYLRNSYLDNLSKILADHETSENDRFVAWALLKNAVIAAEGELPLCQDTGTAIVYAEKGEKVTTGVNDAEYIAKGIFETYRKENLRYSQIAPITMLEEKNTENNLPAQIDIASVPGDEYRFLCLAKGGGSQNKTYLFQENKSLLEPLRLFEFLKEKIVAIGTAACPPYRLSVVIGGTSPEENLKCVKLAAASYYDTLPSEGNLLGRAFRDYEWERRAEEIAEESQIGAQFGGKYFTHEVRVIRLPRHAASCFVGIGVSCSADRQIKAKITREGVFIEELERTPEKYLPQESELKVRPAVSIDLDQPIETVLKELSKYPVLTRVNLSGTLIVARDGAHARYKKMLDEGKGLPDYLKKHPVYYAGPAKTPLGKSSGSFGPTTAERMDRYVADFMKEGASLIMIAKGNRSPVVREACQKYGGFYLGSIGGPGALLARENILHMEVSDFEDLGMEAVHKITVKDFPVFILIDNKGNDFFNSFRPD